MKVDVVVSSHDTLGEGVIWDPRTQRVLWTDIHGKRLHHFRPATGHSRTIALSERLACFTPLDDTTILAGFASGLKTFAPDTGLTKDLHPVEAHLATTRLNDGRVDRQGRFIFGTMDEAPDGPAPLGAIWSFDGSAPPRQLIGGIGISNSITFSPDGRKLYMTDTPTRVIYVCDYDIDDGVITGRRPFVELLDGDGYPDGSTVDTDGCLWNAEWGGRRVVRYRPDGLIDRVVSLPCQFVTCCSFGGSDLRTLYITTARNDLDDAQLALQPEAGSLFAAEVGVTGLADTPFIGLRSLA